MRSIQNLFGVLSLASSGLSSNKDGLVLACEHNLHFGFHSFIVDLRQNSKQVVTMIDHALIGSICYGKDVRWHLG